MQLFQVQLHEHWTDSAPFVLLRHSDIPLCQDLPKFAEVFFVDEVSQPAWEQRLFPSNFFTSGVEYIARSHTVLLVDVG